MKFLKSFAARLNFYVLSLTAFFFLCLGIIFYLYISRKETDNARMMTLSRMETISLSLDLELELVQDAIERTSLTVFKYRNNPEKMKGIIEEMVTKTDTIYGGGVAFKPGYISPETERFMEYFYWETDTTLIYRHFGDNDPNYLERSWFIETTQKKKDIWSSPYQSGLDRHTVMVSYSDPVFDEDGEVFAVVTADLRLMDLTNDLEKMNPYEGGYSFIVAQDGTYLSHPDRDYILNETILSATHPEIKEIGKTIIAGGKGAETIRIKGERHLVAYSGIRTTDCVICCIIPYSSILKDLGRLTFYVLLILCIGLLCLMGCMHIIVKKESKPVDIMEQDLSVARKIQEKMLPDISEISNVTNKVDVSAFLRPARDVGGDLYDLFEDKGKLYFAIGDVSGKGVPAALIMSLTKSFFRSCSKGKERAEDIVGSMNALIMENDISNMFITFFVGILDLEKHKLSFCNAGHELPAILTQGKEPEMLGGTKNLPIGIMKDWKYEGDSISLAPGDKIFIYTDGVTEAENIKGDYLGTDAILGNIKNKTSSKATTSDMLSLIDKHAAGKGQTDDITMMCITLIRQ